MPFVTLAEAISLLGAGHAPTARLALFAPRGDDTIPPNRKAPSLFVGRADTGLFAKPVIAVPVARAPSVFRGSDVDQIRQLIGQAESRRNGYDAVQHGARIKPPQRPTAMTIADVLAWIDATPGQPHAIGKYQFVPKTLRRVVKKAGVSVTARFSPQVQDQLADVLLVEAGLLRFRKGDLGRTAFMNNLARIWAGLPNSTGRSHYHGYAGNKATMTWAHFDTAMRRIDPALRS